MKNIIKDTLILFAITLVAGLGLGVVYNVTSAPRAAQQEKTKLAAYETVMPGLGSTEDVDADLNVINEYVAEAVTNVERENGISPIKAFNATIDEVVLAKDSSGNNLGYIVTVTDKEAYDGSLQMTVGIKIDGTVEGVSFLSLTETPGLGMKASEESFISQFKGKLVDFFKYTKSDATADNEIVAISSATITTNAVTHGVNAAIYCVDYLTGGGSNE